MLHARGLLLDPSEPVTVTVTPGEEASDGAVAQSASPPGQASASSHGEPDTLCWVLGPELGEL